MSKWEAAVLTLSSVPFAWTCFRPGGWPAWIRILALAAALLSAVQLTLTGYRWQLLPTYIAVAGLIMVDALAQFWGMGVHRSAGWAGSACLAASMLACVIFPAVELPPPEGPFPVGTTLRHVLDRSPLKPRGSRPQTVRELMVQLWYPAETDSGAGKTRYLSDRRQISSFWLSHLANTTTHSVWDARPARRTRGFPLILYSPSWHGQRYQSTFLAEELASRGFVVVGIDHTGYSNVTVFPDGRAVWAGQTPYWDLSSDTALSASMENLEEQVRIRERDLESVLDALERLNRAGSGDLLNGSLDISRVGVLGFSFGGAVAAQACWRNPRLLAGIDMAGSLFAEAAWAGVRQPFLFMDDFDDPSPSLRVASNPEKLRYYRMMERDSQIERESFERNGARLRVRGTAHYNFADAALFSPVRRFSGAGPIDPLRAMKIVRAYAVAFFNRHLNGATEPLLDATSTAFPEAHYEERRRAESAVP